MTPLDDLPPEQRAVLELVLKRGRSYDEIARLLSIDRAHVRERALAGFDALGPDTSVSPQRRALITDYVLGQLPARVSEQVAQRLAQDPADRAWARVISSELRPVASRPLPEIPTGELDDEPAHEPEFDPGIEPAAAAAAAPEARQPAARPAGAGPRSSRLGGAILLGIGALVVILVVVAVLILTSGSSHNSPTTTTSASAGSTTASSTPSSGTTGTTPESLATVHLSPASSSSKAQGVAEAFLQSGKIYLALVAINLAANNHNYYAVWLSNSPSDSRLIGFSPAVTSNGRLQAAGNLTATDRRYKTLLLTLETSARPKQPGTTIMSGAFSLKTP